jgi:parvulin-like peptidyl-prolyl isomerase
MHRSTVLRLALLGLLFGLLAYATPAQDQSTDDVAAAARKAREKQKDTPKPKKVITNDDIPSAPVTQPTPSNPESKGSGQNDSVQAGKTATPQKDEDANGEAYWRKRFAKLHEKLSTAEKELDVLQRELNRDQVQYYADPQKALTQQYDRSDINEKNSKIDAKKKEIEDIKQQISDLEDELRKAGGDSGWAR